MISESHPETDAIGVHILRQRMQLVVACEINGLFAGGGKIVGLLLSVYGFADPFAVDPCPNFLELSEINFRIEVRREVAAMLARVHVHDVDRVDGIELMLHSPGAVSIHDAGIKTDAQDSVDTFFRAARFAFPFVIGVPRRILADFGRIFVNGGI